MKENSSRRAFLTGVAATLLTFPKPALVQAQHLNYNDIWSKAPQFPLRSAVALFCDISGSMKGDEPRIQRDGTVTAITSPNLSYIVNTPTAQGRKGVAVCCGTFNKYGKILNASGIYSGFYGSDSAMGVSDTNWAVLENDNDIAQFANFLYTRVPLYSHGNTNIHSALTLGERMHALLPYDVEKRAIDISGDGFQNTTEEGLVIDRLNADIYKNCVVDKVEALADRGIKVNGFAMTDQGSAPLSMLIDDKPQDVSLGEYFKRFVQTQASATRLLGQGITIEVSKNTGFEQAYAVGMTRKMMHEFF